MPNVHRTKNLLCKIEKIPLYNKNKYHIDFYQKTKYHLQLKYHKIQTFKNWTGMHSRLYLPTFLPYLDVVIGQGVHGFKKNLHG